MHKYTQHMYVGTYACMQVYAHTCMKYVHTR